MPQDQLLNDENHKSAKSANTVGMGALALFLMRSLPQPRDCPSRLRLVLYTRADFSPGGLALARWGGGAAECAVRPFASRR